MLVSMLSLRADRKHSPDADPNDMTRPRWVKAKSADHGDCLIRHQMDIGEQDPENGMDYAVAVAWRALAQLQTMVDQHGITALFGPMPVTDQHTQLPVPEVQYSEDTPEGYGITNERTGLGNTPTPADEPPPVSVYPELAESLDAAIDEYRKNTHQFRAKDLARDLQAGTRPMRYSDPELEGPDVR
jgi:hypothetical protein